MPDLVLQEQVDYYRARAAEYDEWFYRKGRYDHGDESNRVWFEEADSVFDALDTMAPTGDVLELAPGTGIWPERLLRTARYVTAIDASSEMIARNRVKLGNGATRVTFQVADIFEWKPSVKFDAIVFCFWISHVPATRSVPGYDRLRTKRWRADLFRRRSEGTISDGLESDHASRRH